MEESPETMMSIKPVSDACEALKSTDVSLQAKGIILSAFLYEFLSSCRSTLMAMLSTIWTVIVRSQDALSAGGRREGSFLRLRCIGFSSTPLAPKC